MAHFRIQDPWFPCINEANTNDTLIIELSALSTCRPSFQHFHMPAAGTDHMQNADACGITGVVAYQHLSSCSAHQQTLPPTSHFLRDLFGSFCRPAIARPPPEKLQSELGYRTWRSFNIAQKIESSECRPAAIGVH